MKEDAKETVVTIKGTHCSGCKALIEDVCPEIKGVISCQVDYKTGLTKIKYRDDFDIKMFQKEIEQLGDYKVTTTI